MQAIYQRAFWHLTFIVCFCLIVWSSTSLLIALVVFSVLTLGLFLRQIYWLNKLAEWFKQPDLATIPIGSGLWEDVFATIYSFQRKNNRNKAQLSSTLDRFMHAASALPDGVVLLNAQHQIEWCNQPAELLLGLSLQQDAGQPILYLIRHTDFLEYLQTPTLGDPIKLSSWIDTDITLEIQLVPFGSKQKLLIARDVSQLEKLEHMRRDFIANVSHELRTPLTVVSGFLETISDMENAIPDHLRTYFDMMQDQTGRMRMLIEDLLMLSQLENSVIPSPEADVNVPALLNNILNEANSLSKGRHVLSLEMSTSCHLHGALQELHSAFGNLVSNAIRYTPEGGAIQIEWKMRGNDAVFSVRDSGIGIEQQHIDRLTERFYRVDRSRSRETGGTGLGLSIVKHVLTRHHARLEIESEFGKGSVFSAVFSGSRVMRAPDAKA